MNTYQIIANGITLDTTDGINISLNYEIENILKIDKRSNNWSKTITLPGTKINNKFFNHIYDVNVKMNSFTPSKSVEAYLRCDDNTIFTGYLQLLSVKTIHNTVQYEVSMFGSVTNFLSLIEDKYLSDLDFSIYNHIRDRDTIIKSFNYGIYENSTYKEYSQPGNGYVYPHIIYGLTTNFNHNMFLKDWYPALYDKTIVKKMFEEIGYTIKSNWLESEYASKLIYPFVGDKFQMTEEELFERSIVIGINSALTYSPILPYISQGSSWITNIFNLPGWTRESGIVDDQSGELTFRDELNQFTSSIFTCEKTGYYKIQFDGKLFAQYYNPDRPSVKYNVGSGNFIYFYSMEKQNIGGGWIEIASSRDPNDPNSDGAVEFAPSDGLSHSASLATPWIDTNTPLTTSMAVNNIMIQEGEKIRIRIEARYPQAVDWDGLYGERTKMQLVFKAVAGSDGNDFSKFIIEPANNESMGYEQVNMSQLLPDIKQKDYFTDFIKQFNLIVVDDPDNANGVIIEPRDDYYANKQKVLDWESERKMDYDSGYKITPMSELDATTYKFTYTDDSDYYNKQYTEETKKIFGEKTIEVDNDFSDKVFETKLTLAPSPMSSQFIDGRVAPFFVNKDDENFKQMKVKPRRLFYGGMLPQSYVIIQDFPGSSDFDVVQGYPYCGMWDHPTDPSHSLEFGQSDKLYWNTSQYPNANLYEDFHRTTIANIINPNSKLLEADFRLTPKDIVEFDFRNIVFLMGQYWRVNQIKDYDPVNENKLTTVILYSLNDVEYINNRYVTIPTSNKSCPSDLVLRRQGKRFIQVSQSGKVVTRDCCNSIGGVFMEGMCYVGMIPGDVKAPSTAGPISDPTGPNVVLDGNVINSNGVKVKGTNNFVPSGVDGTVQITGTGNTVRPGVKNVFAIGDGMTITTSNTIQIGDTIIDQNGFNAMYNLLQGAKDEVRFLFPTTFNYNFFKGARNSLRDPGFMTGTNYVNGGRDSL